MFDFLKRKPKQESVDSLPPNIAGSQKSAETERFLPLFLRNDLGIAHPFDLNEHLKLYVTDSLAKAIIDAITNLTVSEFEFLCESDELNEYLQDFHHRVDMDRVAWESFRDIFLFGFCSPEIIGNGPHLFDSNKILAVKRLDERYIYISKNKLGRVTTIHQRFSVAPFTLSPSGVPDIQLDPQTIIHCHSLSPLSSSYGQPELEHLKERIKQRNELIDALVLGNKNHANAVNWIMYKANPEKIDENGDEIQAQLKSFDKATKTIDEKGIRWLISGGMGDYDYKRLDGGELPESANLLKELTRDIISSAGFGPAIFGVSEGKASDQEQARFTVNSIISRQRNLISQLHAKLYSILPFIEQDCPANSPDEIIVRMKPPTQQSLKEQLEAEAIKINNLSLLQKAGIIGGDQFAREMGYADVFDKELNDQFANALPMETNPNDPNQQQQARQAVLNDGRSPGNNPKGN